MATSSRLYWKKREEENLRNNLKTEEEYIKTINGYYDYMMDQVQKEINGFYSKYARKEGITLAEAKKRVSELDIKAYERKAAKYVKEKDFSKEANEEMRLYNLTMKVNRLEMLKANIGLELVDGFNDLQKYFEQVLTDRTLSEFQRQAGILGKTIRNNAQAANAIVNASFSNAKFSDRIWMYQDMMKAELSKLLQEGLIQGRNPRQLAIHLEKLFGVSKSNAERLMRTELARVQVEAQKQLFERNGYNQYEFIALGSACDICKAIDGEHFQVKKMMPGSNAPPMHPNCRCSVAAWVDDKEYESWLNEKGKSSELVENSGEDDTINMYRKGKTHRKISQSGNQIISMATYNLITKPAIKNGADIRIADDEWLEHLQSENATAVTIGDVIYFRDDVTVSDVLEEVYHFEQNRKGLNSEYSPKQRTILNEIDAKEYLLSVKDKYRIPEEEVELTERQLESYKKQMEEMKERGEWDG